MLVAACGSIPGEGAGAHVHQVFQSCAAAFSAEQLARLTPGAEFIEALPVIALFVIVGIGWRIGSGF